MQSQSTFQLISIYCTKPTMCAVNAFEIACHKNTSTFLFQKLNVPWRDRDVFLFEFLVIPYRTSCVCDSLLCIIKVSCLPTVLLLVFHITLGTVTVNCLNVTLWSLCAFLPLVFLVSLVIFRWNIIARIFRVSLRVPYSFRVFNPYDNSSVTAAAAFGSLVLQYK